MVWSLALRSDDAKQDPVVSRTPGFGFKEAVTNSSGAVMSVMQAFAIYLLFDKLSSNAVEGCGSWARHGTRPAT